MGLYEGVLQGMAGRFLTRLSAFHGPLNGRVRWQAHYCVAALELVNVGMQVVCFGNLFIKIR